MHKLICVTFSLPPGVGGWLRLLLVALPGLFCLPFFYDSNVHFFLAKENNRHHVFIRDGQVLQYQFFDIFILA